MRALHWSERWREALQAAEAVCLPLSMDVEKIGSGSAIKPGQGRSMHPFSISILLPSCEPLSCHTVVQPEP